MSIGPQWMYIYFLNFKLRKALKHNFLFFQHVSTFLFTFVSHVFTSLKCIFHIVFQAHSQMFFFHICFILFFTCLIVIIVFKLVAGNGNDKDSQFFYELSMCFVGVVVYSIMLHVENCWNMLKLGDTFLDSTTNMKIDMLNPIDPVWSIYNEYGFNVIQDHSHVRETGQWYDLFRAARWGLDDAWDRGWYVGFFLVVYLCFVFMWSCMLMSRCMCVQTIIDIIGDI